jgi:hypothetical protein
MYSSILCFIATYIDANQMGYFTLSLLIVEVDNLKANLGFTLNDPK